MDRGEASFDLRACGDIARSMIDAFCLEGRTPREISPIMCGLGSYGIWEVIDRRCRAEAEHMWATRCRTMEVR